jgi:hypothetical protein
MQITQPVPPGTAIQLARLAHFADLDIPEADELKFTGYWILGAVGDPDQVWESLHDDAIRLWHLISDDWDDRDLDGPDDLDEDTRFERTRTRLETELEHAVWLARYSESERRRPALVGAARRLFSGACMIPGCGCTGEAHP